MPTRAIGLGNDYIIKVFEHAVGGASMQLNIAINLLVWLWLKWNVP